MIDQEGGRVNRLKNIITFDYLTGEYFGKLFIESIFEIDDYDYYNVEKIALEEGLNKVFEEAGFEFRQPGCSACLAMNEDKIPSSKYCVSTSNRNFEGRQGPGSRTFLASPVTAAISAINGYVSDIRNHL